MAESISKTNGKFSAKQLLLAMKIGALAWFGDLLCERLGEDEFRMVAHTVNMKGPLAQMASTARYWLAKENEELDSN